MFLLPVLAAVYETSALSVAVFLGSALMAMVVLVGVTGSSGERSLVDWTSNEETRRWGKWETLCPLVFVTILCVFPTDFILPPIVPRCSR